MKRLSDQAPEVADYIVKSLHPVPKERLALGTTRQVNLLPKEQHLAKYYLFLVLALRRGAARSVTTCSPVYSPICSGAMFVHSCGVFREVFLVICSISER